MTTYPPLLVNVVCERPLSVLYDPKISDIIYGCSLTSKPLPNRKMFGAEKIPIVSSIIA